MYISIFLHICRILYTSYLPGAVTETKCDAQVYTTAGREEKRQYLRDLGVKYITSSRNGPLVITHVVLHPGWLTQFMRDSKLR